jgi:hypothetical protein
MTGLVVVGFLVIGAFGVCVSIGFGALVVVGAADVFVGVGVGFTI